MPSDPVAAPTGQAGTFDRSAQLAATEYRVAADRWLEPLLRPIADGTEASVELRQALVAAVAEDPIQRAFAPAPELLPAAIEQRLCSAELAWPAYADWWRGYFGDSEPSMADLWRLYLPFAHWIIERRRVSRPAGLFVAGVNGSPGAGKTVFGNALATVLNVLLDPLVDGQAVARSSDDWYLGKAAREQLRAAGYDPGLPGVSNRGVPGTHDLDWLLRNLAELQASTPDSVIELGDFDKRIDDQPAERLVVRGKVAVLLLDGWFVGAGTDYDPLSLPAGLRRAVATSLRRWQPIFDRMDALWAFDWPSYQQMLAEREAQEQLAHRQRGARGMTDDGIRAFMSYLLERSWDWRVTSPIPPRRSVSLHACRDASHRVVAVRRGERPDR